MYLYMYVKVDKYIDIDIIDINTSYIYISVVVGSNPTQANSSFCGEYHIYIERERDR